MASFIRNAQKFVPLPGLIVALLWALPVQAQQKLVIESPAGGQILTSTHVVVAVKVDPSVKRVKAAVTIPIPKKAKDSEEETATAATPSTRTVFSLGPVDLERGAERWSPDLGLGIGENTITVTDADNEKTTASVTLKVNEYDHSSDPREDFQGTFYVGASIDSFASNETRQYIGYTASDSGPKTGYAAGVDFEYRVFKRNTESRVPLQLWLFGETVHSQRSSEVDCSQAKSGGSGAPPVCAGFNPDTAPDAFLAVLRNASSLEGYAGARLEFLKLNRSSNHSANLYAKSQLGLMTVQNNGGDVVDNHTKLAVGAIMTNGSFGGSYLDVGWGRTDLFAIHRGRRFKIDGYIEWDVKVREDFHIHPFFQMLVDSDFGPGSDDVRSYYGINVDMRSLSCLFNAAGCAKATTK